MVRLAKPGHRAQPARAKQDAPGTSARRSDHEPRRTLQRRDELPVGRPPAHDRVGGLVEPDHRSMAHGGLGRRADRRERDPRESRPRSIPADLGAPGRRRGVAPAGASRGGHHHEHGRVPGVGRRALPRADVRPATGRSVARAGVAGRDGRVVHRGGILLVCADAARHRAPPLCVLRSARTVASHERGSACVQPAGGRAALRSASAAVRHVR